MTLPKNHKLLTGTLSAALALGIAHPVSASSDDSPSTDLENSSSIEEIKSHPKGDLPPADQAVVDPTDSFSSPFDSSSLDEELSAIDDGSGDGDAAFDTSPSSDTSDTSDSLDTTDDSPDTSDSLDTTDDSPDTSDSLDTTDDSPDTSDSLDTTDDSPDSVDSSDDES